MSARKMDEKELEVVAGAGGLVTPEPSEDPSASEIPQKQDDSGGSVGNTGIDNDNQGSGGNTNPFPG